MKATSTPSLTEFDPNLIPYQYQVIEDVRCHYPYANGTQQILLSGAVGSAKSLLLSHLVVTHCLLNPGAYVGIGRLSLPSLRGTLFKVILEHLADTIPHEVNESVAMVTFPNGSVIKSFSWSDKKYLKVRSFEFTAFAFEELTENTTDDIYREVLMRVGRLSHVQEKWIACATNPDGPDHWAYKQFIESKNPNIHVYYSKTDDNPFLPESYKRSLRENLDAKRVRRMIYGEWIAIAQDVIYYEYDSDKNYKDQDYQIDPRHPIWISFDFNIGEGKPMSCVLAQYLGDKVHYFDQAVVEGARTTDILEDLAARGLFDINTEFIIAGDASGKNRDTRSIRSDYDIIKQFLSNYRTPQGQALRFKFEVPLANPPVRTRHNLINTYCQNDLGAVRLYVYKKASKLDEGFRLTKLKPGGHYVEDDSKDYQHITTAAGYCLFQMARRQNKKAVTVARR